MVGEDTEDDILHLNLGDIVQIFRQRALILVTGKRGELVKEGSKKVRVVVARWS